MPHRWHGALQRGEVECRVSAAAEHVRRTLSRNTHELLCNFVEAGGISTASLVTQRNIQNVAPQWLVVPLAGPLIDPSAVSSISQLQKEQIMMCSQQA